jgi:H+/Cl- antiporter ClcA
VGVITSKILPDSGVDPGVYAVLGATGFMGGVRHRNFQENSYIKIGL